MIRLLLFSLLFCIGVRAQTTPFRVNGVIKNNPNLATSATALVSASGSTISISPTNLANAQIAAGAAIEASKLDTLLATEAEVTASIAALKTGSSAANDIAVFDGTGLVLRRSTSASTVGDASSATFTQTFNLSGATDPVITAANNALTLSPATVTIGDSSAASVVLASGLSGATDPQLTFANNSLSLNVPFTTTIGSITAATHLIAGASSRVTWSGRGGWQSSGDGAFSVRNNADTANGSITAGQLTLTPAAADTPQYTGSGSSTTGSGTTKAFTSSHTANTSGNIDGVWTFSLTDTASGASTKILNILGGAAGTTAKMSVDKDGSIVAAGLITAGTSVSVGTTGGYQINSKMFLSAPSIGQALLTTHALVATNTSITFGLHAAPAAAKTLASAATIAPLDPITFVSGTTTIDTITAPTSFASTGGSLTLIPTGVWATSTSGNIALITTAVVSKALTLFYDQATAKWYPSY